MSEEERQCKKCGNTYPLTEFQKDSSSKEGRRYECRTCLNRRMKFLYRTKRANMHLICQRTGCQKSLPIGRQKYCSTYCYGKVQDVRQAERYAKISSQRKKEKKIASYTLLTGKEEVLCSHCNSKKPIDNFYIRNKGRGKGKILQPCKACESERHEMRKARIQTV